MTSHACGHPSARRPASQPTAETVALLLNLVLWSHVLRALAGCIAG